MSILKVRDLGRLGILCDIDPYDLPLGAWSFGTNIRFADGRISRAPVWRTTGDLATVNPRYVFAAPDGTGADTVFLCYQSGVVDKWANSAEVSYTRAGYSLTSVEATWTSCSLANVTYVNRADRPPWGLVPGATAFTHITGWDNTNWTAKLLRAYNGALVAFNVTKSGTNFPTLVKTSDIVTAPSVMPSTWDAADPTNNATENPLTEMKGAIVDACVLGNAMIIYGSSQNYTMHADGSKNIYSYNRMPFDGGAINANCAVEVDGRHYVFGPNDIYMHDGLSKVSLVAGKNRKFIYRTLNASQASKFFVVYNPNDKTIAFNYVSADRGVAFNSSTGCNRAAVFSVTDSTWTFDDLPLVYAGCYSTVALNTLTYSTVTATYDTIGGTYQDLEDGLKKAPIYVGETSATYGLTATLYVQDPFGEGSVVTAPVSVPASPGWTLERDGIDLDEINIELRGYKHILSVYPEGRLSNGGAPIQFAFGSSDYFGITPTYSDYQPFDGSTFYKLDYTNGGRYLSMLLKCSDYRSASLSGLDLDVEVTADF